MVAKTGRARVPSLLWRSSLRYAGRHRWQTLLSALGIMLGVMMVVAVDLANNSARRAFDLSVQTVSGAITHQVIGGPNGVPDAVFSAIRTSLELRRSAPSVTGQVNYRGQSLTLLGLDMISEASLQRERPGFDFSAAQMTGLAAAAFDATNGVLMTQGLADKLGLRQGDSFRLAPPYRERNLTLAATLDSPGEDSLIFADIALAQELLNRTGRLDSIDLVLTDDEALRLRAWLPESLVLVEAGGRNAALEQMTQAFRINLLAMSLLALLVAALLIYNTVSLAVLERRASFGVMRSLGTSRGQVARLIIVENAVLGAAASAAGTGAGLVLGGFLVKLVTQTIDDLYFNLTVTRFIVEPLLVAKGFAWGLGITLLAAALPAWQAGRSLPITLQQTGTSGVELQKRLPLYSVPGLVLLAAGFLLLLSGESLVAGFAALNLLVFGFCLLVPQFVSLVLTVLLFAGRRLGHGWRLALRGIQSGLDRTALAVAALTVAVSVTVGVGVMTGSLRDSVLLWLDQTLAGDVQITRFDSGGIPAELEARVLAEDAVAGRSYDYLFEAESEKGPVRIQAHGADPDEWLFMKSGNARIRNNEVLISEPMAWFHGLQTGDTFTLYTATRKWTVRVAGIFYDYTTGNPLLAITEEQLHQSWPGMEPRRLTLYLEEGVSQQGSTALLERLRAHAEAVGGTYGVADNRLIHEITLDIFDRTFAITHVLRLLSIVVAFVGVLSAMLALQLQRQRDYAVLRASGMTIGQTGRVILQQTLVMGLLAGLLALPLGMLMSDVLIDVINQRSFGWSMQHSLPLSVLGEAVLLAAVAALLAGIYPAVRVARVHPAEALRRE